MTLPQSRPMPRIGARCHELKIKDGKKEWRIVYRTDPDCVLAVEVFLKKTNKTPQYIIDTCKKRLSVYDSTPEEMPMADTKTKNDAASEWVKWLRL